MVKDNRTVLRTHVRSLAVQSSGIVIGPENIQKLFVADLRRVELYLDDFGVAGLVGADVLVTRVLHFPTCIANGGRHNSFQVTERLLHTPKAACSECSFVCLHSRKSNDWQPCATTAKIHLRCVFSHLRIQAGDPTHESVSAR